MRKLMLTFMILAVAGVAAAAEVAIPNRLGQVKEGEWVLMQDVSGGDRAGEKNKITVTKVGDGVISLRREHYDSEGTLVEAKDRDMDVARLTERVAKLREKATNVSKGFLMINDKEIPVVSIAFKGEEKDDKGEEREFIFWISDQLPIGGMAKTWCSDPEFPQAEVVDYGF